MKTLSAWQNHIHDQITGISDYYPPMVTFAALVEEIGELSREINHRYSDKKKRGEEVAYVNEEMGDVLFTLICLANQLEVDLEKQLDETLRKWSRRQEA